MSAGKRLGSSDLFLTPENISVAHSVSVSSDSASRSELVVDRQGCTSDSTRTFAIDDQVHQIGRVCRLVELEQLLADVNSFVLETITQRVPIARYELAEWMAVAVRVGLDAKCTLGVLLVLVFELYGASRSKSVMPQSWRGGDGSEPESTALISLSTQLLSNSGAMKNCDILGQPCDEAVPLCVAASWSHLSSAGWR
jgi:hypothetical protein